MSFFKNILDSIYNPSYYRQIAQKPLTSSISYFLLLALLLTVIQTITFINPVSAGVTDLVSKAIPNLVNSYPKELSVTIKNGSVSTNVKEPYVIPLQSHNSSEPKNLIVITTKKTVPLEQFYTYNSLFVLTKYSLITVNSSTKAVQEFPLRDVKDMTINRTTINQQITHIRPYFKTIVPVLLVCIGLGIYIGYLLRFVYLLALALLIFALMKFLKRDMKYEDAYKIGIHAITVGLIVEAFLFLFQFQIHTDGFPLMTTLLSLIVVYLNLKDQPKTKVATPKLIKKSSRKTSKKN